MSDTMLPVGRGRRRLYIATLPERVVRAAIAVVGGAVHETAQLLLPRLVRRSRFYEATAKNLLRVAVELVGGVQGSTTRDPDTGARELAVRKGAGNIVELGSIAAFGFSPLWLLAGASDILRGSRVYLEALVEELKRADLLAPDVDVESVDDLLGVLERGTGSTARLIDIPPVELSELRRSLAELRSEGDSLPSPAELSSLFQALRRAAKAEERPLLDVSTGVGLAFLTSAKRVSRKHLVIPYRDDWRPVGEKGFGAYASRVSRPYRDAVLARLDESERTYTERLLGKLGLYSGQNP